MLQVAYKNTDNEKEQRIELLARQFVKNHIKKLKKKHTSENYKPQPHENNPCTHKHSTSN